MTFHHAPKLPLAACLLAAFTTLPGAVARADVLFSPFGAGDSYANSGGRVSGTNSGFTLFELADRFTAGSTGSLSQLEAAVNLAAGASASAGFIDLPSAAHNPATKLALTSSTLTVGTLHATSATPAIFSLAISPASYAFAARGTRWLILAPHDPTTNIFWDAATDPNATASAYLSQTSGGQFVAGTGSNAFRVSSTVPEPASTSALLIGAGLLLAAARRASNRRQTIG